MNKSETDRVRTPVLPGIDWPQPWLAELRHWGGALAACGSVAERLNALAAQPVVAGVIGTNGRRVAEATPGSPWNCVQPFCSDLPVEHPRFVAQAQLPAGIAYESFIAQTGCVPTRDNLHDLLNGLVWLRHGALKRRMNCLQSAAIARDGIGPRRGPLRDALTLFDENGAWWHDPDPLLLQALQRRDWQALFVEHRRRWQGQRLEVVGHALLEQLCSAPRKGLTAHVLTGAAPLELDEAGWSAKPFLPLPVLGIPGWWPCQDVDDFYRDAKVFRPSPS